MVETEIQMESLAPVASGQLLMPRELREQAELFSTGEADDGRELLTVDADRAGSKHNGKTLERRERLRDEICLRLCEGLSQRAVCRIYGVGRNTIAALVSRLERDGKMEPYKKRMSARLARVIEAGTELFMERVEKGDVPTNVLPVAVGIFSDKKAMLDGEATVIVGQAARPELTQEGWDRWLAELPRAKTIDAQSTVTEAKPQ